MAKRGKADESVDYELNTDSISSGKGRPTPTRKEREAANLRPLVSNDRKAASKESRMKLALEREKARVGMAAGEEKYLPLRDRGAQRRWTRDYVDARFSVGEVLIPVMLITIVLTVVNNEMAGIIGIGVLWLFFFIAVIDSIFLGFIVTRRLAKQYGAENVQRGTRWYAAMRALQMRVMRLPKPQVKRGQFPA